MAYSQQEWNNTQGTVSNDPVNIVNASYQQQDQYIGYSQQVDPINKLSQDIHALTALCKGIKEDQALLQSALVAKIDDVKNELLAVIDDKITCMRQEVKQEFELVYRRVEGVENNLKELQHDDFFNPKKTLVVTRLNLEQDKTDQDQAKALIRDGLGLDTEVVRAKRLSGRDGKPGILKVELPSLNHKIEALRRKVNLKSRPRYQNVYVRSSQSYEERLSHSNLRLLVDTIPDARNKFRVAGNGRLVERQPNDRPPDNRQAHGNYAPQHADQRPTMSTDPRYSHPEHITPVNHMQDTLTPHMQRRSVDPRQLGF